MGWWNAGENGSSLMDEPTGSVWGDEAADIMDDAIDQIVNAFREDWNRNPTYQEMVSGIKFTLSHGDEKAWKDYLDEFNPWTPVGAPKKIGSRPNLLNAIPE